MNNFNLELFYSKISIINKLILSDYKLMARQIEVTPLIQGEDAQKFLKNFVSSLTKKHTKEENRARKLESQRMKESYKIFAEVTGGLF